MSLHYLLLYSSHSYIQNDDETVALYVTKVGRQTKAKNMTTENVVICQPLCSSISTQCKKDDKENEKKFF